jgi:hypothetical protein
MQRDTLAYFVQPADIEPTRSPMVQSIAETLAMLSAVLTLSSALFFSNSLTAINTSLRD